MNEKPNPGYGYELCAINDESVSHRYWDGNWHTSRRCHCSVCEAAPYRRPIKPPANLCIHGEWVLLPENEKMRGGNSSQTADVVVFRSGLIEPVFRFHDTEPSKEIHIVAAVFRRLDKPEVKPDDGWRETAKEQPENGKNVWIWDKSSHAVSALTPCSTPIFSSHWKPAEVPAPPVVKSDAEKAWEENRGDYGDGNEMQKKFFIAGFNAAKK